MKQSSDDQHAPDNDSITGNASSLVDTNRNNSNDDSSDSPIYYFGYGPMVHPMVQHRRGVRVCNEHAAILRNHRLTFAFGGVASVVPQTGYDVHGVLMQCQTPEDWDTLQASEGGYYPIELEVFPYPRDYDESSLPVLDLGGGGASPEEGSDDEKASMPPVVARVFVMHDFDESKLGQTLEQLPQERYLRLIATGLAKYGGDEDYISDQIMGIAFKPSVKPEAYASFPVLPLPLTDGTNGNLRQSTNSNLRYPSTISTADTESIDMGSSHASSQTFQTESQNAGYTLPKISLQGYQRFCRTIPDKLPADDNNSNAASKKSKRSFPASSTIGPFPTQILFLLGGHVILVHNPPGAGHPGAIWLQQKAHAKRQDVTFCIHKTCVDPGIPFCDSAEDVTAHHQAWAENLLTESIAQGLAAHRVFELIEDDDDEHDVTKKWLEDGASMQRLQAFLQAHQQLTGDTRFGGSLAGTHSTAATSPNNNNNDVSPNVSPKPTKKVRRRSTISKLTGKIKKEFKLAAASLGSGSSHNHK